MLLNLLVLTLSRKNLENIFKIQYTRNNRKCISTKVVFHYCCDKGHIRPLCHIRNIKMPNDLVTRTFECPSINLLGPNVSWKPKFPY